jgi:hypothetical protein
VKEDELELALTGAASSSESDQRAAARGLPLADFECPHGRLLAAGERCELCERSTMLEDLMTETLGPPEGNPDEEVPCQYCGAPAPRLGPYAGRCPDHKDQPSKSKFTAARKRGKRRTTKSPSRAARMEVADPVAKFDRVAAELSRKLTARAVLEDEIRGLVVELNGLLPDGITLVPPA